jgi:hypothetical protein
MWQYKGFLKNNEFRKEDMWLYSTEGDIPSSWRGKFF